VFKVPRSTLKNEFNSRETGIQKLINMRLVRKPELPYNLEEEHFSYCLRTEREVFGLTTKSIKRVAFDLPTKKLPYPSIFSTTRNSRLEVTA
jgi:hypothetical protein